MTQLLFWRIVLFLILLGFSLFGAYIAIVEIKRKDGRAALIAALIASMFYLVAAIGYELTIHPYLTT